MTSEQREVIHDQHTHPSNKVYFWIGVALFLLTFLEVLGYLGEVNEVFAAGTAALIIGVLSAAKFILVVMFYMHLKFDSKLFTGIFIFPALLGTLVIVSLYMLFHVLPALLEQGHVS
ncbi:MAG TPA: cytochrome C oxidase subunit IV family protein [Longimicrobiaceae bacterium]|nr:cytochrome C oxidase subunit IV family protein [Longimicrobiaceae bacterium]